jgi:hypothetical protein
MKLFETLDESTFLIYSAKNYYNPTCIDAEEFYEDIKRFKYIKRLLNRHLDGGKLSVNLILNQDDRHWTSIKPFLVYLRVITNETYTGIEMDARVIEELRKI